MAPFNECPSGSAEWAAKLLDLDGVRELTDLAASLTPAGRRATGEVKVIASLFRSHANCSCGWDSGPRFWRGVAIVDAHIHAAGGCGLASPLVVMANRPSPKWLPERVLY